MSWFRFLITIAVMIGYSLWLQIKALFICLFKGHAYSHPIYDTGFGKYELNADVCERCGKFR